MSVIPTGGETVPASGIETRRSIHGWRHGLAYLVLVLLHASFTVRMAVPTALYDEFIYLGFGRFFAGAASLPNVQGGAYGSFGYGLVIAPAFLHGGSFGTSYRLVLLLNSVLISLSYFFLYYIARRVLCTSHFASALISFLTCLYPSFLLFSNYAISENIFVPLYLLTLVCVVRFVERPGALAALFLGLSAGLLYTVHSRSLGILVVTAALFAYLVAVHKCPLKNAALGISVMLFAIAGTRVINGHLMQAGWGGGAGEVTISGTVLPLLSVSGMRTLAICLIGQIFYLLISTCGLWAAGMIFGVVLIRRRGLGNIWKPTDARVVCIAFFLLSFISVLLVSSAFIASYDPGISRPDFLFTGRYNEGVVAILLLFGLAFVTEFAQEMTSTFRVCLVIVVLGFILSGIFIVPMVPAAEWLRGPASRINIFAVMGWLRCFGTVNLAIPTAVALGSFLVIYHLSRFSRLVAIVIGVLFMTLAWSELRADVWNTQRAVWGAAIGRESGDHPFRLASTLARVSKDAPVSYDMASWDPFLYANYQLWFPKLKIVQFDSKRNGSPGSDIVLAGKNWQHRVQPAYTIGCETIANNCLFVNSPTVAQELMSVPLGTEIGSEIVLGVDADGLYPEEGDSTLRYRWTNGNAMLRLRGPATAPEQVAAKLIIPAKFHLRLKINEVQLFEGTADAGRWERTFRLPRFDPGTELRISLQSGTFVPEPVGGYTRTLGVQLVSIRLL